MKHLGLFSLLIPFFAFAQNYPDCSHLKIENIYMDGTTPNLMKVVMSNSCLDCASGLNGCVYLELNVIEKSGDEDTIAASSCMCLISPDNNSQKTYSIASSVSVLPPANGLRVSLMAGLSCGCDDIPFLTLGTAPQTALDSTRIFPNPTSDYITISSSLRNHSLRILDARGILLITKKMLVNDERISTVGLSKGIYLAEIVDNTTNVIIKTLKFEKE